MKVSVGYANPKTFHTRAKAMGHGKVEQGDA